MADLAEKLRYARDRMGLKGHQIESATGIGTSSLSEFEKGKRMPSLSQLVSLARVYNRSTAFFMDGSPIPQEAVLWRQRPTKNAEDIEARFLRLCEQYSNLEAWCDAAVSDRLPRPDRKIDGYYEAESLADQVRKDLDLGERPGGELLRILEEYCSIKIFYEEFKPTGPAASASSDRFGSAILLNAGNVSWRRNFDLAHELFHLLTWEMFRSGKEGTSLGAPEEEEKLAGCFASNLLMPRRSVIDAVQRYSKSGMLGFAELYDIAREFDVSVEALLWRLHFVFNKGSERKQETEALITKARERYEVYETRESPKVPDRPVRFKALAIEALHKGNLSIGRFAEYMGISRARALDYVKQETEDIEQIEVTAA
jgi:XRE family transcriptional regulator, fatty acid utilization regulator